MHLRIERHMGRRGQKQIVGREKIFIVHDDGELEVTKLLRGWEWLAEVGAVDIIRLRITEFEIKEVYAEGDEDDFEGEPARLLPLRPRDGGEDIAVSGPDKVHIDVTTVGEHTHVFVGDSS